MNRFPLPNKTQSAALAAAFAMISILLCLSIHTTETLGQFIGLGIFAIITGFIAVVAILHPDY